MLLNRQPASDFSIPGSLATFLFARSKTYHVHNDEERFFFSGMACVSLSINFRQCQFKSWHKKKSAHA